MTSQSRASDLMDIQRFIRLPHRFRWGGVGGDDCMTFAASWVQARLGVDPAADLRGTYSTRLDAMTIIDRHGGYTGFMDAHLLPLGLRRIAGDEEVSTGDIGLVSMEAADEAGAPEMVTIAAVSFGPNWLTVAPSGIIARRATRLQAWKMPNAEGLI